MLTTEGAIATKIKESLEPEYLKHQIENKSFDLAAAMNYVGHQMLELCAPMRDRSIRALKDEKDMAIVMMSIMEILEGMKLDLANYRLQSIRPQLVRQAVQFEKAKFDKAVQDNRVSLNKTTAWLNESVIELQRIADERNPDNIETPEVKTNFDDVLNHAYLQTFFGTKAPNSADIAETMVMDSERIFNLQNEFQALAIVASLGIVSKNMFASIRKDELAIKELKEKLFDILKLGSTNVDAIATLIISVCNGARERKAMLMTNLSKQTSNPTAHDFTAVTDEESQAVRNLVERTISYKDPLFALIFRRIQSVVRTHLSRNVFKAETLPRQGLDMIAAELQILSEKVVSFCSHNKQVHHTHFNAILESLIK